MCLKYILPVGIILISGLKIIAQTQNCNSCIGGSTYANPNCNISWVQLNSPPVRDNSPFQLIFEENFNGSTLNLSNWEGPTHHTQVDSNASWDDFTCSEIDNVTLSNGYANLQTKYEPTNNCAHIEFWAYSDIYPRTYTAPSINTKQLFGPGKFEIRCKIPYIAGQWTAFWLYGYNPGQFNYEQEIDVFEIKQDNQNSSSCSQACPDNYFIPDFAGRRMVMTSHYKSSTNATNQCALQKCFINTESLSDDFHTYTLIWDENIIEWFLDGNLVHKQERFEHWAGDWYKKNMDFPRMSQKMTLIVSTSIWNNFICTGLDNEGMPICASPDMPVDFLVDYVKVWKRSCDDVKTICQSTEEQYMGDPTGLLNDGLITGKIINTSSSCSTWVINSGSIQMFRASEEINLVNFEAKAGSDFSAKVNTCDILEFRSENIKEESIFNNSSFINNKLLQRDDFLLFPNPNQGTFNLSIQSPFIISPNLYIIDLSGRILYTQSVALHEGQNRLEITRPELPSGIYFIKVDGFDEPVKMIISK